MKVIVWTVSHGLLSGTVSGPESDSIFSVGKKSGNPPNNLYEFVSRPLFPLLSCLINHLMTF